MSDDENQSTRISNRDAYLFACILCEINTGNAFGQDQRLFTLIKLYLASDWRQHRQLLRQWHANNGTDTGQHASSPPFTAAEDQLLAQMFLTDDDGDDDKMMAVNCPTYSLLHALGAIMFRSPVTLDHRWQDLQPSAVSMLASLQKDSDYWRRAIMEIDEPIRLGTASFNRDSQVLFESVRGLLEGSLSDLERIGGEVDSRFVPLWTQPLNLPVKPLLGGIRVADDAAAYLPDIKVIEESIFSMDSIKPNPNTVYGCQCNGDCTRNPDKCSCLADNFIRPKDGIPYKNGVLYRADGSRQPIFECHSQCSCANTCGLRVIQNNPRGCLDLLEIFKTPSTGLGVRATERIPRGTFIAEYVGERVGEATMILREEIYNELELLYSFSLDYGVTECDYIDSVYYGNATRFLNHSCDGGNLVKIVFFMEYTDRHLQRIGFFSNRDIYPGEELTFCYGSDTRFSRGCLCSACQKKTA